MNPPSRSPRHRDALLWWTSLVSLCGFVLSGRFGTAAVALSLFCWLPLVAAWPARMLSAARRGVLIWIFPALALASATWSLEPQQSLRLATELLVFTGVALVLAGAQGLRETLSALLLALILGAVLSIALNENTVIFTTGEVAMTGIFVSKNNLANFMCLLLMVAAAVLTDGRQKRVFRLLGILAVPLGLALLAKARSLGALVAGSAGITTILAAVALASVPRRARGPVLVLATLLGFGVVATVEVAFASGFDLSELLASFGKDTSLTGRTFLWSRAHDYIGARPLLGVGYQAFWVQGHVEAEGLWRYAHVPARVGFHFHNLFYETAVELGWAGVAALGGTILAVAAVAMHRCLTEPGPASGFCAGLMVYFLFRVYVELDFLDPFSPGTLFLPLLWVACRPRHLLARHRAARAIRVPGATASPFMTA